MVAESLSKALAAWRAVLGDAGVIPPAAAQQQYGPSTVGLARTIGAALRPRSVEQVVALVGIASQYAIPLYPFSTGHNWGYSDASPATDHCVLVDLSGMNQVLAFDEELALITLQPGVTQAGLRAWLDEHAPDFLVPVTGGGPTCSILGNALERGYGITPLTDHFAAVTALQAVLPNGDVYRSPLAEMGGELADRAFKWKIGPYLDGLFAQGNFGIVTEMTIRLARRPERIEAFFFGFKHDQSLEAAVGALRATIQAVGGNIGGVNLMNPHRVLAMSVPYPHERVPPGAAIPPDVVAELARANRVQAWTGVGAIYGDRRVVRAVRQVIRQHLGAHTDRLLFLGGRTLRLMSQLLPLMPGALRNQTAALTRALSSALAMFNGVPSELALALPYWKSGGRTPGSPAPDPARDGTGLIWYSPLVPMKANLVRAYVEMVKRVCAAHGIDPLITLTTITDGCFDSSVPILFDRQDPAATARAQACYRALFEEGKKAGLPPYRAGLLAMDWIVDPAAPCWRLVHALKQATDPQGIMAPGRYA